MEKIKNSNQQHQNNLSRSEKLASALTDKVGTVGFFFLIFTWTVFWLGWNIIAPKPSRFDPYPAFVLWLFISNLIQIFLMPLIMIGQNLQAKHAEAIAENDYHVNLKAEKEIKELNDKMDALLREIKALKA